jgi:hypothetical protein
MSEIQGKFTVILADLKGAEHKQLTDFFISYHNNTLDKASWLARRCNGILIENAAEEDIKSAEEICSRLNINIIIWPAAELASVPPSVKCINLNCQPAGLEYTIVTQGTGMIQWNDIIIASSGLVKEEKNKTVSQKHERTFIEQAASGLIMATTGLPITIGKKKETTKEITEIFEYNYLEIFTDKEPYCIRVDADNFNYNYLGNRKQYSGKLNYRILIEDINKFAVTALKNRSFTAIINKEQVSLFTFDSYESFRKESRWLLTLAKKGFSVN